MIEEKYERLSLYERDTVYDLIPEAIYYLIKQCPYLEEIPLYYLVGNTKTNITVVPAPDNARYVKKYVSGSFSAKVDFQIQYKCFPGNTAPQRIEPQKVIADIMKWLETTNDFPLLSDNRRIIGIEAINSFAINNSEGEDGNIIYVSSATLTYFKKKHFNTGV